MPVTMARPLASLVVTCNCSPVSFSPASCVGAAGPAYARKPDKSKHADLKDHAAFTHHDARRTVWSSTAHRGRFRANASSKPTNNSNGPVVSMREGPHKLKIKDPAHLHGTAKVKTSMPNNLEHPLDKYMRLPVEQYVLLGPGGGVERVPGGAGDRFYASVPPVKVLGMTMTASFELSVRLEGDIITIVAENCKVKGPPILDKAAYEVKLMTQMSWGDKTVNGSSTGFIDAKSRLDIWSEVLPPLKFLPKSNIERVGNAVLDKMCPLVLGSFVKNLQADYLKWAADANYRESRAAGARMEAA